MNDYLARSRKVQKHLMDLVDLDDLAEIIRWGGTILLIGNGGGQAEAEHWASHLVGAGFIAFAPAASGPTVTMLANDGGFEDLYRPFSEGLRSNDLIIAFSASGRSPDITKALSAAECFTVFLSGAADHGDVEANRSYQVPVTDPRLIEDAWQVLGHALMDHLP